MKSTARSSILFLPTLLATTLFMSPTSSGVAQERRSTDEFAEQQRPSPGVAERRSGSSRNCTQKGCGDAFEVTLHSLKWMEGTYEIQFLNDRDEAVCEIVFVQPDLSEFRHEHPSKDCGMRIVPQSGGALDPTTVRIAGRSEPKGEAVRLRIVVAGQVLSDAPMNFEAREFRPNGAGCEPTCVHRSMNRSVEMPTAGPARTGPTDAQIARVLIEQSRAAFRAKGHSCGCAGDRRSDGKPCLRLDFAPLAERPYCRISDVSRTEVEAYRQQSIR